MIAEQQIELIVERLVRRVEQANIYFLMNIGSSVKKIRSLKPSEAHKLIQMLKYGSTYDDIVRELAKYTNLNIKDVDKIFEEYAKKDTQFYEQFYDYRNRLFTPFEENTMAQQQEQIIANVVKSKLYDFARPNVLGYTIRDLKGNPQFVGLRETYNRVLDEALLNIDQGKESFDSAMARIMKDIGGSGLKTVDYQSTYIDKNGVEKHRKIRLDSAVSMQLKDGLQQLHLQNQMLYGEQFDADGVEITVHETPAPDHAPVQGRQFSNEEFEKLQNGEDAKDYKNRTYNLDHDNKNGYRPIGDLNCRHNVYPIILGVSKPEYSDKQLQQIIDRSNEKVEIDGKEYTRYECTQLQRMLERKIRQQKDIQIFAKSGGNKELIAEAQSKITTLTRKYKEVSDVSGLPTKMNRTRVSGYRRTSVDLKKYYEDNLIGLKNDKFEIKEVADHIIDQKWERNLHLEDLKDTFTNPLDYGKITYNKEGLPSVKIIGRKVTTYINPETQKLTTWHRTHKKTREKYEKVKK